MSFADDLVEGVFCESCGEYLGEPTGHPRRCGGCGGRREETLSCSRPIKARCPECGKWCKGLADHRRVKHGVRAKGER
jgi:hypothetical protein